MDVRSRRLDIRQAVGFVPEDECLFPRSSASSSSPTRASCAGWPRSDALQRAHEVLDYVGLGEARYRKVDSYSTGMKQRLKIASAIVHDPRLLILDEPTNGMDPAGREEVLELGRDLARNKGMSLLFSSHLLPDVEAVCDHVMVLGRGRLLASGADRRAEEAAHPAVRGCGSRATRSAFAGRLAGLGVRAEPLEDRLLVELADGQTPRRALGGGARGAASRSASLRPRRSTLEEVFLDALAEEG